MASDLSETAQEVLRVAVMLRSQVGGTIQVLHVSEHPLARLSAIMSRAGAGRVFEEAQTAARRTIEAQIATIAKAQPTGEIDTRVVSGECDTTLLEFIRAQKINLLVIGTEARSGLARIVLGNTTERLLPSVHCSLLIVKPRGFRCPVHLAPAMSTAGGD